MKRYQVMHCQNTRTGQWRKVTIDRHAPPLNQTRITNRDTCEHVCSTEHDTLSEANKSRPRSEFVAPLPLR